MAVFLYFFTILKKTKEIKMISDIRTKNIENIYTCSFCGKQEKGKPVTYLRYAEDRAKAKLDGTNVALRPDGWDWDIFPVKFTDSWSCGCHTFYKNH